MDFRFSGARLSSRRKRLIESQPSSTIPGERGGTPKSLHRRSARMPGCPPDVERAHRSRNRTALKLGGSNREEIGAASREKVTIFFRKRQPPLEPAIHWIFAENIDATYRELKSLGANIVDPLKRSPSSPSRISTGTASIYAAASWLQNCARAKINTPILEQPPLRRASRA